MINAARGRFIVFEGIDASGKSTQARRLAQHLQQQGRSVHLTAEPTAGPIGSLIRQAFSGRTPMDDRVIAALFVADRIDHLTNERDGVLELLGQGLDVISDRYYLSSVAYHASDVDMDWILRANELSTDLLRPDLTLYLDLDPERALSRLETRSGIADKFEDYGRLQSAHRNYENAIRALAISDSVVRVPAGDGPDETFALIQQVVAERLVPLGVANTRLGQ